LKLGDPEAIQTAAVEHGVASKEFRAACDAWYAAGEPKTGSVADRMESARLATISADQARCVVDPNWGEWEMRKRLTALVDPEWTYPQVRELLRTVAARRAAEMRAVDAPGRTGGSNSDRPPSSTPVA